MYNRLWLLLLLVFACTPQTEETQSLNDQVSPEKITFQSQDGLPVSALLYHQQSGAPFIILCHQAGASKVEYANIAPALNRLGFNCLAIDQRGGGSMLDFANDTQDMALKQGLSPDFPDARKDIMGALQYVHKKYHGPVILWGSSYSASMVLDIANHDARVSAVVAFSPAQYNELGAQYSLKDSIQNLNKPTFVSSSRSEANEAQKDLLSVLDTSTLTHFVPQGAGSHGSASLWKTRADYAEYWAAIEKFLADLSFDGD